MSDEQWQLKIKSGAKADLRRVLKSPLRETFFDIKATLTKNPYEPIQSFEKLVSPAAGYYSRRLNGQHRVVYKIDQKTKMVFIYSCWSHYESGELKMSGKSGARRN